MDPPFVGALLFCSVHHCCHCVMTSRGTTERFSCSHSVLRQQVKTTKSLFSSCQQLFCTVSIFVGLSHFTTAASPADPLKPISFVLTLTIGNKRPLSMCSWTAGGALLHAIYRELDTGVSGGAKPSVLRQEASPPGGVSRVEQTGAELMKQAL